MIHTLFVFAHPDDETLAASVAIAEHVAAGQDVHVLWLSRGEASGVRAQLNGLVTSTWWGVAHDPAGEGYQPLSPSDLGVARIDEAIAAVRCLGAGLPGTITTHEADLDDGQITQADACTAILSVADAIAPGEPVRLKTHSWLVDNHPDHIAAGEAARALRTADPTLFGDVRFYVESPYWANDPRLTQVVEAWDNPASPEIAQRVRNAVRSYGAWQPEAGAYAIGYHSVAGMLDQLATTPKCMVHP